MLTGLHPPTPHEDLLDFNTTSKLQRGILKAVKLHICHGDGNAQVPENL